MKTPDDTVLKIAPTVALSLLVVIHGLGYWLSLPPHSTTTGGRLAPLGPNECSLIAAFLLLVATFLALPFSRQVAKVLLWVSIWLALMAIAWAVLPFLVEEWAR